MDSAILTALISFVFGTVLGTYLRIRWERSNAAQLQKQEYKTQRYKAIIILMYGLLDFDKSQAMLKAQGRFFNRSKDLVDELMVEWNNALLFASDNVLRTLNDFIKNPTQEKFRHGALAMREDLWGGKVSLKLDDLFL
jgi:hypothetical protein